MSDNRLPTLWQIDVSHYSEKARWGLAWKSIEHRRRSPVPGAHMAIALWLTRGAHYTFPVLSIDGRRIGDSTATLAALNRPSARGFEEFREPLVERRGLQWVKTMFHRHRQPAKAPVTAAASS